MKREYLELDAGKMAYIRAGSGPNMILMHSLGFSADSFNPIIDSLAGNYTVYALDMLGHGYSDKTVSNYLIEDYGKSVIEFMDKLNIRKANICGNSIGAFIAVEMAVSFPKRIEKLILIGLAVRDTWQRMERLALAGHTSDSEGNPVIMTEQQVAGMGFLEMTPERLNWINEQWAMAGKWTIKGAIACTIYDVAVKLQHIKCPTLIVYGNRDIVRESGKILTHGINQSRLSTIENAGHLPHIDQPETVVKLIKDFLVS